MVYVKQLMLQGKEKAQICSFPLSKCPSFPLLPNIPNTDLKLPKWLHWLLSWENIHEICVIWFQHTTV